MEPESRGKFNLMFRQLREAMQHQVDSEGFVATAATPAWLLSLTLHILLLILISLLTYSIPNPFELTLSMADVEPIEEVPQEFQPLPNI